MLTPLGLVAALVIASPALWSAANGSLGLGAAMLRLLAAFALVAVATAVMRRVTAPQAPAPVREDAPRRRRDDD